MSLIIEASGPLHLVELMKVNVNKRLVGDTKIINDCLKFSQILIKFNIDMYIHQVRWNHLVISSLLIKVQMSKSFFFVIIIIDYASSHLCIW